FPPGRAYAVKKVGSVLTFSLISAYFGYRAITFGFKITWAFFIFNVLIVLAMLPSTIRVIRRTRPVLIADAEGITCSLMFGDVSRIRWTDVAGVETFTADKQTYIVITGLSESAVIPGVHAFATGIAKGLNKKSHLSGIIYIPA